MISRIVCTGLILLFAGGNFFSDVLLPPGPMNPFGIVFLALSGVIWFGWDMIRDAYAYQEERRGAGEHIPDPMLVRLGPVLYAMPGRKDGGRGRRRYRE